MTPARIGWNKVSINAIFPPGWIPCDRCNYPLNAHVDLKCPFDSVNFSPQDAMEIWQTLSQASKYAAAELKTGLADLPVDSRARCYKEIRKQRLLDQLKRKR